MSIKIGTYILTCDDDTDILGNAVDSVALFSDKILLVDTGAPYASQNPRPDAESVRGFYEDAATCYPGKMDYVEIPWDEVAGGHAILRNKATAILGEYDWVCFVDSDEMPSNEFCYEIRGLLENISPEVVTIVPHWLTLWPDEEHYSLKYSQLLSHGRIVRPNKIRWVNAWHEHQNFSGKRHEWSRHILHFRQLFTNRCMRQRGHGGDAWPGINNGIREVSELDASWMPIRYPIEDEKNAQ